LAIEATTRHSQQERKGKARDLGHIRAGCLKLHRATERKGLAK
jgi:hypothetical protein